MELGMYDENNAECKDCDDRESCKAFKQSKLLYDTIRKHIILIVKNDHLPTPENTFGMTIEQLQIVSFAVEQCYKNTAKFSSDEAALLLVYHALVKAADELNMDRRIRDTLFYLVGSLTANIPNEEDPDRVFCLECQAMVGVIERTGPMESDCKLSCGHEMK